MVPVCMKWQALVCPPCSRCELPTLGLGINCNLAKRSNNQTQGSYTFRAIDVTTQYVLLSATEAILELLWLDGKGLVKG
jgi:hypothetical protein